MDSEHRHELKQNELAEWIHDVPKFLKDNMRYIIGGALIIVAIVFYVVTKTTQVSARERQNAEMTGLMEGLGMSKMQALQSQSQDGGTGGNFLIVANQLEVAANEAKSDEAAALALIKRGDALRADLYYRPEIVDKEVLVSQMQLAEQSYEKALDKCGDNHTLSAAAKIGQALCKEEKQEFGEAIKIYTEITGNEDYAGTIYPAQAKMRLDTIEDRRGNITFAKAPEPVMPPPTEELEGLPVEAGPVAPIERQPEEILTEPAPQPAAEQPSQE